MKRPLELIGVVGLVLASTVSAAPLTVTVTEPPQPETGYFKMGVASSPEGHRITVDSRSLRYDGQPWIPVMGEFHFSRYPADEWRSELLKMKAGGIDVVATYVFWIHHEETEGKWNWSGDHDLRRFVGAARDVGLHVIVRCGPWCHGEVRNGGLPEWVVERKDWKVRSTDEKFLAACRTLYAQIAQQIEGLLWKDGGPVIGVQVDNEYGGPAAYLLALKGIAREVGLDVPLYTRTGWPALATPMPLGEILPLYGVYAEGFWDRELTSMPGRYWVGFHFSRLRSDAAIATEMLGTGSGKDEADVDKYPYATCEIGGGMMSSYHRRILIDPRDIESTTVIKIGSGSTLPGYYMYHGGRNPEGEHTTLMEAQNTLLTNWNDMPVKTYDFQAPLGEFGEVRPHYHRLRRLHSFLRDHGSELAGMLTALPDQRPAGKDDVTTLRWAARSDGRRGFVFLSNYERSRDLPAKTDVQFAITLADGSRVVMPHAPVTIPSGAIAWWPFNLNLGGATLSWATAQPFSHILEANGTRTVFFAATPGVESELAFATSEVANLHSTGRLTEAAGVTVVRGIVPSRHAAVTIETKNGNRIRCVVLDEEDSLAFWKGPLAGRNRAVISKADLVFDGETLHATATGPGEHSLAIFPAPRDVTLGGRAVRPAGTDGLFVRYTLPIATRTRPIPFELVRPAGALREIKIAPLKSGVAMQPTDEDFTAAAVWRIRVPEDLDPKRRPLLRLDYVGDVARVLAGGKLVTDDFYNGNPRHVGLWRREVAGESGKLEFAVLPLQKGAPIFLAERARPEFGENPAVADLRSAVLIETVTVALTATAGDESPLPSNFRTDVRTPARARATP